MNTRRLIALASCLGVFAATLSALETREVRTFTNSAGK
jgi:hypothetical protein